MAKLALPDRNSVTGAEVRLLLAEARGPAFSSYVLSESKRAMQFMDRVLYNRLQNKPSQFGAASAKNIIDIIKAKGQFAGFEKYPIYDGSISTRIQKMLDIANNAKDRRAQEFTDFIEAAIDVAENQTVADPSTGLLTGWRTGGASSPGGSFKLHATVGGIDFYFI
ncbi:hypothetical protein LJR090_005617 [Bosea sp. LjRoot90]|uniref:hypothetical protein n=1 Tax=Bosea sp. LjRoot90 TaxID=3342342 RepID=UPI003ECEEEE6